ncbi:MAG TPA: hypothetical protein VJP85_05555 [Candidatus Baltobacteraceae bacterium]|nr:hypothetical protein [Candidatus Baltobacteraceae bacterium]
MIHALLLAAIGAMPPCWDLFDSALRHSANAAHPPYVTYSERIAVSEDGNPVLRSTAHVDYRDDGIARVSDERFNFEPFVTHHAEPGPPELGPYGKGRAMWLPDSDALPIIAQVRTLGAITCTVEDEEPYKAHDTYHLVFTGASNERPTLKDLWIDTRSHEIWKLIVTGPVAFWDDTQGNRALAEFQVELGYSGPYLVVNHVVWSYDRREFSQQVHYFGEYTFTGYAFPSELPASYFGDAAAALK